MTEQSEKTWIKFDDPAPSITGKTSIWTARSIDGDLKLGTVSWFGRWRRYAFYPEPVTVFEQDCLRAIATFCEERTRDHQAKKRSSP